MDLSPGDQVERALRAVPAAQRPAFVARAENLARLAGDLEVLRAVAAWRLRAQFEAEKPRA